MTSSSYDPQSAVIVGRVIAPHGVHGELKVEALTDFLDRFSAGSGLWLDGGEVVVERGRWTGRTVILKLRGIDDRNAAEPLRGKQLTVTGRRDLEDDTYYRHEIIGLTAVDPAGEPLGKISEVFETGSNDVYVVTGERGELLLPATEEVVVRVDIAAGVMVVDVLEGLEWERPPKERRQRTRPDTASPRKGRPKTQQSGTPAP